MHHDLIATSTGTFVPLDTALAALEAEGFQAPSQSELEWIVRQGLLATGLLYSAMVLEPEASDLQEFFCDFIIRAVNRGPGVGDAGTN